MHTLISPSIFKGLFCYQQSTLQLLFYRVKHGKGKPTKTMGDVEF
jgi:hypothetical protein